MVRAGTGGGSNLWASKGDTMGKAIHWIYVTVGNSTR